MELTNLLEYEFRHGAVDYTLKVNNIPRMPSTPTQLVIATKGESPDIIPHEKYVFYFNHNGRLESCNQDDLINIRRQFGDALLLLVLEPVACNRINMNELLGIAEQG